MSLIYQPKDVFIIQRNASSSSFEEKVLSSSPNSLVFFNSASILTSLSTSSFTASWALNTISASLTITTESLSSASWASQSLSSSYVETASWSVNALTASMSIITQTTQSTAIFSISSSWASSSISASYVSDLYPQTEQISASWASASLSSSYAPQQQNISVNSITASYVSASNIQTINPTNLQDVATKGYVDAINPMAFPYYFRSASADVNGYNQLLKLATAPLSSSITDFVVNNVSASQYIYGFISSPINQTSIPPYNFMLHYHIYRVGGGSANTFIPELYLRNTASIESEIVEALTRSLATDVNAVYDDTFLLTSSLSINPSDRFVVKFKMINGTGTPNIHFLVEDNTLSRLEIPILASSYVLSSGDTMTGPLTTSLYGTSSWANNSLTTSYTTGLTATRSFTDVSASVTHSVYISNGLITNWILA